VLLFVVHENIKRFERLLASEDEPGRRTLLTGLVETERAKLLALRAEGTSMSATVVSPLQATGPG